MGERHFKAWADESAAPDDDYQTYRAFMKAYYPGGDPNDVINFTGYAWAYTLAHVLEQCGTFSRARTSCITRPT